MKLFGLSVRQIEAFKATVEAGSVTRAAKKLNVSQPSVSRMIHDLERDLSLSLFYRDRNQLRLTNEGVLFFEEVQRCFQGMLALSKVAGEIRALARGQLRIASLPALALEVIPRVTASFNRCHGDIFAYLAVRSSRQIVHWASSGFTDIGIIDGAIPAPGTECLKRFQLACVCALPQGHPLQRRDAVTVDDLKSTALVAVEQDFLARSPDGALLYEAIADRIRIETHQFFTACAFVVQGLGAAIVDPFTAAHYTKLGIVTKPLDAFIPFDLAIVRGVEKPLSLACCEFLDLLVQEIETVGKVQAGGGESRPGRRPQVSRR
jgi:DNA-binding transcriptional LysR family regulator